MKEVTYEKWIWNPTPRIMWVWNEDEMYKVKRKVVHVLRNSLARVITIDDDDSDYELYNHCAELEKENEGLKAFESHCDEIEEDAKAIAKENAELKEKLDKIRKYLVYDIFDRFKYLENLLKINQEKQEELSKCIIEQQKTTGSLTDIIYELKTQIGKM